MKSLIRSQENGSPFVSGNAFGATSMTERLLMDMAMVGIAEAAELQKVGEHRSGDPMRPGEAVITTDVQNFKTLSRQKPQ
ncbi:MAG: hypothetical protein ACT4OT_08375 [Acidobacteriota bacterium]